MRDRQLPWQSNQTGIVGQQLLHHPLLEELGRVAAGFVGRDPGVHVGEDGGDGVDEPILSAPQSLFTARLTPAAA